MTTMPATTSRRSLLRLAGGAAGAAALAACTPRTTDATSTAEPPAPAKTDLLYVTTTKGLAVIRTDNGKPTLTAGAALTTPDWQHVIATEPEAKGTRFVTREPQSGRIIAGANLPDRLEPRVVSPDGRMVALATPGAAGSSTYRPAGRERTTIVVADAAGERVRMDLPGNLEPEALPDFGSVLYVLDYLPPAKPDRYRVRAIDLNNKQLRALLTKDKVPVPAGAEEEMRGEGRQAVYDRSRQILFTLYTHQPDHEHTRDLVNGGARRDAPHVHAFVHSLHLEQGWAFCIDLPSPFGERPAAGHAIALQADNSQLYVVDTGSGKIAHISPESLTVQTVTAFDTAGMAGEAVARAGKGGELVVGAGTRVVSLPSKRVLTLPATVRGLVQAGEGRIWVGQENAAVRYDLGSGTEDARVEVPGLVALRHVLPA
jgi:hypothetical protein